MDYTEHFYLGLNPDTLRIHINTFSLNPGFLKCLFFLQFRNCAWNCTTKSIENYCKRENICSFDKFNYVNFEISHF